MRTILNSSSFFTAQLALALLAVVLLEGTARATPMAFDDGFDGPGLDAAWNQGGDPNGHPASIAGTYDMTDAHGSPGVKLSRSTSGSLSGYTHEIEVTFNPLATTGTDFKWKSFGADGFMEIVLNSFGNMRIFHNDFDGGGGDIQSSTNIGIADGDLLKLTTVYNANTDTIDVSYSLNGGSTQAFYSGGGIDGPIDDLITNFVEFELFKFGSNPSTQAVAAIDRWRLAAVPEPTSIALLAIASLSLVGCSRRNRL